MLSTHDYLAYGEELTDPEFQTNNMKFTGHERDPETGLDYMLARYYSSGGGRFLQVDPGYDYDPMDPMSFNLYSYVRGNPVMNVDPTGMRLYAFEDGQTITVDDGIDEVYSVTEDACTRVTDTDGDAITQRDFLDFAATVYAESGSTGDQSENSAIADSVVNRANEPAGGNISDVLHSTDSPIIGASSTVHDLVLDKMEGKTNKWTSGKKTRAAVLGVVDALTGNTDESNGAYYWESTDYLDPTLGTYDSSKMYPQKGWGTTRGLEKGVITFLEVARHEKTVFMKYNPAVKGSQVWP